MPLTLPTIITATELKLSTGQILRRVAQGKEHLIVERDGYPIAVIMPIEQYHPLLSSNNDKKDGTSVH